MKLSIGEARPDEFAYVNNSWKESAFDSPVNAHYKRGGSRKKGNFYTRYNADVQRILDSGALVLVARDPRDQDFIFGWATGDIVDGRLVLYYAYTRSKFRQLGVMRALLRKLLAAAPDEERVYCARSRFDGIFERHGFKYAPLSEVLGEMRRSA